jgi:hypothetical protein
MSTSRPLKDNLHQWLKGNPDAISYCLLILRIAHTWDDLIDRDKVVSDDTIHTAFWAALIDLPQNPFYAQHFHRLHPIMQVGILSWKTATTLERSATYEHKLMAFSLRCAICDVITMCALILGGPRWAEMVHGEIQTSYPETVSEYLASLPTERGA